MTERETQAVAGHRCPKCDAIPGHACWHLSRGTRTATPPKLARPHAERLALVPQEPEPLTKRQVQELAITETGCPLHWSCGARPGEPCRRSTGFQIRTPHDLKTPHRERVDLWLSAEAGRREKVRLALQRMVQCSHPEPLDAPHDVPLYCRRPAASAVLTPDGGLQWRCPDHEGSVHDDLSGRVVTAP